MRPQSHQYLEFIHCSFYKIPSSQQNHFSYISKSCYNIITSSHISQAYGINNTSVNCIYSPSLLNITTNSISHTYSHSIHYLIYFTIRMSSWLKHVKFRQLLLMSSRNNSVKSMALKGYPFLASSPPCHFYPHFHTTLCTKYGKISFPILCYSGQVNSKILTLTKAVNSCHLFGELWTELVPNMVIQSHLLLELQPEHCNWKTFIFCRELGILDLASHTFATQLLV